MDCPTCGRPIRNTSAGAQLLLDHRTLPERIMDGIENDAFHRAEWADIRAARKTRHAVRVLVVFADGLMKATPFLATRDEIAEAAAVRAARGMYMEYVFARDVAKAKQEVQAFYEAGWDLEYIDPHPWHRIGANYVRVAPVPAVVRTKIGYTKRTAPERTLFRHYFEAYRAAYGLQFPPPWTSAKPGERKRRMVRIHPQAAE